MKTIYCDLKAGMTREQFLANCSNPESITEIEVCFDSVEDAKEFDSQCMCFPKMKNMEAKDFDGDPAPYIEYDFEDFYELERNISFLVANGWTEEDY